MVGRAGRAYAFSHAEHFVSPLPLPYPALPVEFAGHCYFGYL